MNRSKKAGMGKKTIVILLLGLALASVHLAFAQPAEEAQRKLQGTWTATKAERDGKAADDVVGHRLSFTGNRFQIQSKDGKPLYAGTVRVESAKPAAIDFEHTEGAPKGEGVEGDLCPGRRHADDVRQRTEPGRGPARRVRGKEWVRVCPHHVQAREPLRAPSILLEVFCFDSRIPRAVSTETAFWTCSRRSGAL